MNTTNLLSQLFKTTSKKQIVYLIGIMLLGITLILTISLLQQQTSQQSRANQVGIIEAENAVSQGSLAIRTDDPVTSNGYIVFGQECSTSNTTWQNKSITPQTTPFTLAFDMTPNGANIDAVTGLSNGTATHHGALGVIVRFNPNGFIDARNGGTYAAATQIPYVSGKKYAFFLEVNIPNHTYTVYVTPEGEQKITVGSNFSFRTEQLTVTQLSNLATYGQVGSHTTCASNPTTLLVPSQSPTTQVTPTPTRQPLATPTPTPISSTGVPQGYGPRSNPVACDTLPHARKVPVSTFTSLQTAINNAIPGDLIIMADGLYASSTSYIQITNKDATSSNKITLCGSRKAVVQGISTKHGIHLNNSDYWTFYGFSIRGGVFGVYLQYSSNVTLSHLDVGNTRQSAIHNWNNSANMIVQDSHIHDAGEWDSEYGEGVYVGMNAWMWDSHNGNKPDTSNNAQIIYNHFGPKIRAEAVDFKEVTGGLVKRNYFDGSGMLSNNALAHECPDDGCADDWYVDSWVDLKGNGITVTENYGDWLPEPSKDGPDGYEVTRDPQTEAEIGTGIWGRNNVFSNNFGNGRKIQSYINGVKKTGGAGRYMFNQAYSYKDVTTVYCNNTFINFQSLLPTGYPACKN